VTAVQVLPVMQPSAWQREYSRFSEVQDQLLAERRKAGEAVSATVGAK